MCGRARCALSPERVEQITGVPRDRWVDAERYAPSYNVQPGRWTPILRLDEQHMPLLQTMKWGLVPSFTKPGETPDHFKMFNARSETVTEKPIFSRLLPQQRCVVLFEGFYEWKADAGGKKQPYYVHFDGEGSVMRMAGLYDVWKGGPEGPLATYTILTVDSSPKLTWLHNRMPVLLPDDAAAAAWLGTGSIPQQQQQQQQAQQQQNEDGSAAAEQQDKAAAAAAAAESSPFKLVNQLCTPCGSAALQWHPVSPAMSKPSYDCPEASQDVRTKKGAISSFFKPTAAAAAAGEDSSKKANAKSSKQQQQQHVTAAAGGKPDKQQQQQQVVSPVKSVKKEKKGSISSFFQPVSSSPTDKGTTTQQVRNPDEQAGPSAADNAAAAAKTHDGSGGKRRTAQHTTPSKAAKKVKADS